MGTKSHHTEGNIYKKLLILDFTNKTKQYGCLRKGNGNTYAS